MKKIFIFIFVLITFIVFSAGIVFYYSNTSKVAFEFDSKPSLNLNREELKKRIVRTDLNLLMFGDMMFENPLFNKIQKSGFNPFKYVEKEFKKHDFVIGNLETTIDGKSVGSAQAKAYTFSAPKQIASILSKSGVNIVSYANNHSKDYGEKSINHTIDLLNKNNVKSFGAGSNCSKAFEPLVINKNGNKIAFLAFNSAEYALNWCGANTPGTAYFSTSQITNAILNAKKKSDIVIVWSHWGTEQTNSVNAFQKEWARRFVDLGADLVVGAHPHVRQGIETYKNKKIYYSLGNFLFPGMQFNPEAQIGYVLNVKINKKKIVETKVRNVRSVEDGVPRF